VLLPTLIASCYSAIPASALNEDDDDDDDYGEYVPYDERSDPLQRMSLHAADWIVLPDMLPRHSMRVPRYLCHRRNVRCDAID